MKRETGSGLNKEQRDAVEYPGGPLLIIAGAGTGKTRVITRRIAHLISEGVEPSKILALTFTEKAAREMEARVDALVPYGYSNVFISTFHSFCDRVLRDNALYLGLPPDYKILGGPESVIFLKRHIFKLPLDYFRPAGNPSKYLGALIKFFGRLKDEDVSPGDFLAYVEGLKKRGPEGDRAAFEDFLGEQTELAESFSRYQGLLEEKGFIDLGDLVTLTLKLFRRRPNILKRYEGKFLHILADEFQDTNYAQFELLKLLAGERKNISVVADDDQCIYKFRGAAVSNVLNFLKAFPEVRPVTLKRNYRSVQPILDAAYRLITHNNPDRLEVKGEIDKKLIAARGVKRKKGPGPGVEHINFNTVHDEADFVAGTIYKNVKEKGALLSDHALLVRARSDAAPFLHALDSRGIPYHYSGNSGLFSRAEVMELMAFLRAITDFSDNLSLFQLATSPVYGIEAMDIIPCNNLARRQNRPLFYIMEEAAEEKFSRKSLKISENGLDGIKRLVEDIKKFSRRALKESAGRVLYSFLTDSGYMGNLASEDTTEAEEKVRNIAGFFEKISSIDETLSIKKTANLVEELELLIEAGENPGVAEPDADTDAVQVLTVHKAKGLEFPVVFMVSLIKDRFPRRARRDPIEPPEELIKDILPEGDFHLQEERRLFYVGMTRAMENLFLTSASDYGGKRARKVSPFVIEALDKPRAGRVGAGPMESIKKFGRVADAGIKEVRGRKGTGPLTLSYYKIDDYLTCPLKYRFIHILKIPLLPHHTIMYGKAVHDAISFYFRRTLEKMATGEEEFLNVFRASWRSEGFVSKEHEEQRFSGGLEALKRFFAGAKSITPKAVEREFNVDITGDTLNGRWDLIVEREDGPHVIDFKTSDVRDQSKADKKTKSSTQLLLYNLAFKEVFGALPAGSELHFVETGLVGRASFKEKDIVRATAMITEVASGIRKREFTARPDYINCNWCAYNSICTEKQKNS
ncbi:MAG: ATP-dependent helicase [Thermodesulfobacteriota bacterium]